MQAPVRSHGSITKLRDQVGADRVTLVDAPARHADSDRRALPTTGQL